MIENKQDTGSEQVMSLFDLEYNLNGTMYYVFGKLHCGTDSESNEELLKMLKEVCERFDKHDVLTPHYTLQRYRLNEMAPLQEPNTRDMKYYPVQLRDWIKKVGFRPAQQFKLWESSIAITMLKEKKDFQEFQSRYRNVEEALRTGEGLMGHGPTMSKLDEERAKLSSIPNLMNPEGFKPFMVAADKPSRPKVKQGPKPKSPKINR